MSDPYRRKQTFYQEISGEFDVTALSSGTFTVATIPNTTPANYTMFIQRVYASITGAKAGDTWVVQDSSGKVLGQFPTDTLTVETPTGAPAMGSAATPGVNYKLDFGPIGASLTAGANLQVVVASGNSSGIITWEGYVKRNSVTTVDGSTVDIGSQTNRTTANEVSGTGSNATTPAS